VPADLSAIALATAEALAKAGFALCPPWPRFTISTSDFG
jgi:hypothetical protein